MADAYAAPGVALAWAVLRGSGDAATVVIRVNADREKYAFVAVDGVDPFTRQRDTVLPTTRVTAGPLDLRISRGHFADFPRTELRFFGSEADARADTPDLVIFYLGVPDTTPEIAGEDRLAAYLAQRMQRLRTSTEGRTQ